MSALLLVAWAAAQAAAPATSSLQDDLRRARDESAVLEDRLAAARRAHSAAPGAETALLLKTTYLDVQRGQLARTRSFERQKSACPSPDEAPLAAESCVRELLARAGARAAFVELVGDELLAVVLPPAREPEGLLFVRGLLRRATQQRGLLTLQLELVRERGPRDAAVESVLFAAAPATTPGDSFVGPILSEGARRLLAALPERYVELSGPAGHRFVQERCAAPPPARALELSVLGQARLVYENGTERASEPLLDAWKAEGGVELAFQGARTVRLRWPSAEREVADWSGVPWATAESFPRKAAQGCSK